MLALGLYVALIAFVLVQASRAAYAGLYFQRPLRFEPRTPPDLPPFETAQRDAIVADLERLGFVRDGDVGIVKAQLPNRPAPGDMWLSAWKHPAQQTYALLHVARTEVQPGTVSWIVSCSMRSRLPGGRRLMTTSSVTRSVIPGPASLETHRLPTALPSALWAEHLRLLGSRVAEGVDSPLEDWSATEIETQDHQLKVGALVHIDAGHVGLDPSTFAVMMAASLNPITGEARAAWKNALLFVGLVVFGAGYAHHWMSSPDGGILALGAVFTSLVIATSVLFPKTSAITVIAVLLSAIEVWRADRGFSGYALIAALVVGPTVGSFVAKRLTGAQTPGEVPWLTLVRLGLLALGVFLALLLYLLARVPREEAPTTLAIGVLGLLALSMLMSPVLLVLMLFPKVRANQMFQVFTAVNLMLFPADFALGKAMSDNQDDRLANAASGASIVASVRAHHGKHGALPATLEALVPAELPSVPSPRTGWPGTAFDYAPVDATHFTLSYRTWWGRHGWLSTFRSFVPGPMASLPIPVVEEPRPTLGGRPARPSAPETTDAED